MKLKWILVALGMTVAGLLVFAPTPTPEVAYADGSGGTAACNNQTPGVVGSVGNDNDEVTYDAGSGNVITGVCIKSGNNMFGDSHSGVLGNGTYENGCYEVSGVGTDEVTVERIGTPSPTCQGISHIDVVVAESPPTLVIEKECEPDANADETFTFDITAPGSADGEQNNLALDCGDESDEIELEAGVDYSITEDMPLPAGWTLDDISCTDVSEDDIVNGVTFEPESGDEIVCTFTNVFTQPQTPTLRIDKICLPAQVANANATFSFNVTPNGSIGDPDVDCGDSSAVINLAASTAYTVIEDGLESSDWSLTSADCTGVTDAATTNGRTFTTGTNNTIVCTFTNTFTPPANPTLVITKVCEPQVDGATFSFNVAPDGSIADPDLDCGDSSAIINLAASTAYTVVEDGLESSDWSLTSADCEGVTDAAVANGRSFTTGTGGSIVCTFTNILAEEDPGSIRIQKTADETGEFSFDDNFGCNIPDLEDGEGFTCDDLPPGLYAISEDVPGDWDLTDIVCTGDDDSVIDIDSNLSFESADEFDDGDDTVLIQLAAGENIVCTFFNEEAPEDDELDENDEDDESDESDENDEDEGPIVTVAPQPSVAPAPPVAQVQGVTSSPRPPVLIDEVRGLPAAGEGFQGSGQSSGWRLPAGLILLAVSVSALAFRSKAQS